MPDADYGRIPDDVLAAVMGGLPSDPRDLLTAEDRQWLNACLKAIHDTMHPCWEDR